jgi:hypothetical protein
MGEEKPTEKKVNVCRVRFKEDAETGWKMEIDGSEPACADSLRQTSEKLGPHAKEYLARRIETNNPEIEKMLKAIGLRTSR